MADPNTCTAANEVTLRYRMSGSGAACWEPQDGTWRTHACAWLVAHDIYHHEPGDKGTLAEELATLGAEYYFEHEDPDYRPLEVEELPPPGFNSLTRSAAGVLGLALENENLTEKDFLLGHSGTTALDNAIAEAIFRAAAESAREEVAYLCGDSASPEWAEVLQEYNQLENVASWIRLGYLNAKARFSDQARARQAFHSACDALRAIRAHASEGSLLVASRTGYDATIGLVAP